MLFLGEIFLLMIFNSLMIFGLFNAGTYKLKAEVMIEPVKVKHDMIDPNSIEVLSYVRVWIENNFGETIARPLIACPYCMASFHSAIPYFTYFNGSVTDQVLIFYPLYICALSALNYSIMKIFTIK
jgi:hypothetical protein